MYFFTRLHAASGGTSRLTAALAAALNLWEQRIKKANACRSERGTYANAHTCDQGSILRKSKSSRMERLGIKCCNYNRCICIIWPPCAQDCNYRTDRSIRSRAHSTTLVTKPTFNVAAATDTLTRLRLATLAKGSGAPLRLIKSQHKTGTITKLLI